jgi:hypothetical protein
MNDPYDDNGYENEGYYGGEAGGFCNGDDGSGSGDGYHGQNGLRLPAGRARAPSMDGTAPDVLASLLLSLGGGAAASSGTSSSLSTSSSDVSLSEPPPQLFEMQQQEELQQPEPPLQQQQQQQQIQKADVEPPAVVADNTPSEEKAGLSTEAPHVEQVESKPGQLHVPVLCN